MSSFAIRDLGVLSYQQGFTLWLYRAGDTPLDEIKAPGFFADAVDMFHLSDWIFVSGRRGNEILVVTAIEGIDVSVAPLFGSPGGCGMSNDIPTPDDGGPAFPSERHHPMPGGGSYRDDVRGMSLQDYFAGKAFRLFVAAGWDEKVVARRAYDYADAMLAERTKRRDA